MSTLRYTLALATRTPCRLAVSTSSPRQPLPDILRQRITEALDELAKERRVTAFAREIGRTRTYVYSWKLSEEEAAEDREGEPTPVELHALARHVNRPLTWFFGEEPEKQVVIEAPVTRESIEEAVLALFAVVREAEAKRKPRRKREAQA